MHDPGLVDHLPGLRVPLDGSWTVFAVSFSVYEVAFLDQFPGDGIEVSVGWRPKAMRATAEVPILEKNLARFNVSFYPN